MAMARILLNFLGLYLFVCNLRIAYASTKATFNWDAIKYVYAFGDSYSFVQGTQGHANFSFIGDALNLPFPPKQLLSNRIIARNVRINPGYHISWASILTIESFGFVQTSSEGSNWLEFLTGCFSGLPSACPKQLWNFAFAGSDIDKALLPLHHDYTVPLVDQVAQWATYASNVIPHPDGQTLTTWWIGINDTGDTLNNSTITDFNAFWEAEMISYFKAVQVAFDRGLRTHLFLNVPPGDRAPSSVGSPTKAALLKTRIGQYNTALARHVQSFAVANPGATVLTFDANSWFNTVMDSPSMFGFTNVTGFCTCANPTGFFWYNSGHPTELVHRLLAGAINTTLSMCH